MKLFYYLAILIIVCGCNTASGDKSNPPGGDTETGDAMTADFMQPRKIGLDELPAGLYVNGTFNEAWQWIDSAGDNILVLSHAMKKENKPEEFSEPVQQGSVYATHFLKKNDTYQAVRTSTDEEKNCVFDLVCDFIPGATTITDLDKNGFAEIKYQYRKTCRSDVSPATVVLVVREKGKTCMLTGTSWVAYDPALKFDLTADNINLGVRDKRNTENRSLSATMGKYESEYQFADAPPVFLTYAKNEWLKYVKEEFGE